MTYRILSINPGSTSTKIAVYDNEQPLFVEDVRHAPAQLETPLMEQYSLRRDSVLAALTENGIAPSQLAAVVGRGGMLPPVKSGGYLVGPDMLDELVSGRARPHASNLGAVIAHSIAQPVGIPAYIYDAVSADEFDAVARITGIPEVVRQSFCHVLNGKATARKVAAVQGTTYTNSNFIVAHIGGGISISAHHQGRIIDAITDDAGPFSPERAGSVPLSYIIDICYHGGYTESELYAKLKKNSGIKGHLGTNDCLEVERRIAQGDQPAAAVYEAQAYQIAKGIGEMAPVLCGQVNAVILTGGLARSHYICGEIARRVAYIGPVHIMPGENEMEALTMGALRILRGEESCHIYTR